ncbi:deoxyribose-phosphate aldolase [Chitinophaga polysaccharea]|uniref:2-amino-3,7-dideoxy-D-threo-hept-6-ulosonate synthase n=1 Tax=Chitinophaga TaxID=79328 RepID=UPI0014553D75|nr:MULTISPECIES: 2-amino-3,7-dideoxy-D-threo-hept-6-ulosonate synthase [Chitinophaga]NLR57690.1 deoxyribose-phosphate aldolase [Chitinophaga polysaccharea]NLU93282.1 deoxyribose-phosphate aldolase [Chitinophaga sp. Ak27]
MNGKSLRLNHVFRSDGKKTCIVPIDHGTTLGPIPGLKNSTRIIGQLIDGGADAIVLHKGILAHVLDEPELVRGTYLLHLSASTCLGSSQSYKVMVGSVEEGLRMGASGISIHVNLGTAEEPEMLKEFGRIATDCYHWGMPLLAMMYVDNCKHDTRKIAHAARLAQEIGADIVKIDYPGSGEKLHEVIQGVQIPVLIAGGSKSDSPADILMMVHHAMLAGASGVSIGRNIFQHNNPRVMTQMVGNLVHHGWQIEECIEKMNRELLEI